MALEEFTQEEKLRILKMPAERNIPVVAVCQEHGINRSTFYAWQKRLKNVGEERFLSMGCGKRGRPRKNAGSEDKSEEAVTHSPDYIPDEKCVGPHFHPSDYEGVPQPEVLPDGSLYHDPELFLERECMCRYDEKFYIARVLFKGALNPNLEERREALARRIQLLNNRRAQVRAEICELLGTDELPDHKRIIMNLPKLEEHISRYRIFDATGISKGECRQVHQQFQDAQRRHLINTIRRNYKREPMGYQRMYNLLQKQGFSYYSIDQIRGIMRREGLVPRWNNTDENDS
ncbi:MAG: transposase [Corynebacterium sp.]|nr:transposase [Corynebacterium sp.]